MCMLLFGMHAHLQLLAEVGNQAGSAVQGRLHIERLLRRCRVQPLRRQGQQRLQHARLLPAAPIGNSYQYLSAFQPHHAMVKLRVRLCYSRIQEHAVKRDAVLGASICTTEGWSA